MNSKTIILLATILFGLVAIAAAPKLFKKENAVGEELKNVSVDLSDFTQETTSKVFFKQAGKESVLALQDGEWHINNEKADQEKVATLFTDIQGTKIKKLASKNDENQQKFKVTPEDGITLVLTQKGQDNEFYLGKSGPSFGTFYVRKKGIKNVYLAQSALLSKLSWDASEWKEKSKDEDLGETTEN